MANLIQPWHHFITGHRKIIHFTDFQYFKNKNAAILKSKIATAVELIPCELL